MSASMSHKAVGGFGAGMMQMVGGMSLAHLMLSCAPRVSQGWAPAMQIRVMWKSEGRFEKGADGVARYEGGETRLAQISASGRLASLKESFGRAFPVPPSLSPEVSHPGSILQSASKLLPHTHRIAMQGLCAASLKLAWRKALHVALRCHS